MQTAQVTEIPTSKTKTKKPAPRRKPKDSPEKKSKRYLVPTFGIFTPVFVLWAAHVGGSLARTGSQLWIGAAFLGCTMLVLSLTHVSFAIQRIARVSGSQAWAYAITLDSGIVFCEVAVAVGQLDGLTSYATRTMLVAVLALSAWMNVDTLIGSSRSRR